MLKFRHRINIPLVFANIILCCSCFILINCNQKKEFNRGIEFGNNWQDSEDSKSLANSVTYFKDYKLNIDKEKIYILEITPYKNIVNLKINNEIIRGVAGNNQGIKYNITEKIKEQNTIELTNKDNADFDAKLHCVNKLFIRDLDLKVNAIEKNNSSALVEIKVKNAFSKEKQATLKYTLYSAENKELENKETPVFIAGNAENFYRQELKLKTANKNLNGMKIICHLYLEGKLFDKNQELCSN